MDMEKVMKGLECCARIDAQECAQCPYLSGCEGGADGSTKLCADALALLKKQAEKLKKQAEQLKGQKAEYKSCSNCSHSKFRAVRGTGCYGYRCERHRMWGACDFHCSDWAKRGERE